MDNVLTTLSFSIQSNRGVYALLLGSGISRNAGIPTGWDIIIDLIKKLSTSCGKDCGDDVEQWFVEEYGEEPNYSKLLAKLVKTSSERMNLLKGYFEDIDGLKKPSQAHKYIAKLVKDGFIKVIITTNFDRLLENALKDEGIEVPVIKHPNDIRGITPIVHSQLTIIKVNGDYLDERFLNTEEELSIYPEDMKKLLFEVFNNFGLISCGWSAKWDKGLIDTIKQTESFRYPYYFSYVGRCEEELKELSEIRKGYSIRIDSADDFFKELYERINAIERFSLDHPLNKEIAVERIKKYISRPEFFIDYEELLENEAKSLWDKINDYVDFSVRITPELYNQYLLFHTKSSELLREICINAVRWGKEEHEEAVVKVVQILSEPFKINGSFYDFTRKFHYLTIFLTLYSIGIACIYYKKYGLLTKVFQLNNYENESKYNILNRFYPNYIDKDSLNSITHSTRYTPLSSLIEDELLTSFSKLIRNVPDYQSFFDIFEYVLTFNRYYYSKKDSFMNNWISYGAFAWRRRIDRYENIYKDFFDEAKLKKDDWEPIKYGLLGGSYEEYINVKGHIDEKLKSYHFY